MSSSGAPCAPSPEPGGAETRERLVLEHAYLCRRAARKFVRTGLERRDLEQTAALGLLKAADRYDHARGTPFEAFAWVAILGELLHYVRDHEHLVRIPRSLHESLPRFRRSADRLLHRHGREATDAELAAESAVTIARVRAMRHAELAAGRHDDRGGERSRERAVAREPAWDGSQERWCDRLLLGHALAALSDRERRVVVGSYVLGLTNVELGLRLALSARHVGRLRRDAIARMQGVCATGIPA